ncbi:hypothetical protein [Flavobacterium granuli]|uniref:Uncharacterized protein n=1 Tax=Flavobacterium granuli TaxID=280093 RepID=A0A1M5NYY4_9FLAO|nr:hypothetical protein [Flavobacterium granuli]PRZ23448.1 hypothetical protein BC624_105170 [Flavobacterium granuli]SHG94750.1 hypothetical protein SAMN05443373_105170 [Flavobacterium granuli]
MKTLEKLKFPKLENEYLENILRQLINQHNIIQLFFTKQPSPLFSNLIIHIDKNSDTEKLQQQKWLKKVRNRYQIDVIFIYSGRLHHRFSLGHPFMECYCRPSALIYQNPTALNPLIITRDWKQYKKKFHVFEERFYHDHDLHKLHVQNLISEDCSNSVFTSYARWIEYDLEYLEELYVVNTFNSLPLDERINNLIAYVPEIQKYFVRSSPDKYVLTDLFIKAKEIAADDDDIYKNEMYQAVRITEQNLFRLIEERFDELKKQIKKGLFDKQQLACQTDEKPAATILDVAVETIVKLVAVEQIYLFHQTTYAEKTTYYLMLIGIGGTNEKLRLITHFLKSKTTDNHEVVMISHSRKWIQENLYQFQSFFSDIIQADRLIYSSSPYHPVLHWQFPHNPYHADLYFYYQPTKDVALQFFNIANNPEQNYQGLDYLFSEFFLSFCRTYIFVKTYYLPNNLTSQALWQLCIYADPDIRKYNYLLEQFWTDCFPYLNKHRLLDHKLSKLNKEKVDQMSIMVKKLMTELDSLVIEGGLLNYEQD